MSPVIKRQGNMTSSGYLQEYRERAGLTLRDAADRMGVSATTIHKWENDQNSPSVRNLHKLAAIYGIAVSAFFLAPNRPKRDDGSADGIRAMAAVAGIHPCAQLWIDGDYERLDEAELFTRMVKAFDRLPAVLREHWVTVGETYPIMEADPA